MAFTVTDAFIAQYSANIHMLAQQMDTRFRSAVYEQPITGETSYLEYIAPTTARKVTARHADTPLVDVQHLRRKISPYAYVWATLFDRQDQVAVLTDPTSQYAIAGAASLVRGIDDEIVAAFFATAYTGHTGATSVAWPNGNAESSPTTPAGLQVAVNDWGYGQGSGNSGLTVSKLISAKTALMAAEGDEDEEMYLAVPAAKIGDLLATTEATSSDYAEIKALQKGTIDTFMGFKFIRSERLTKNGSSQWRLPAWRKSAMGLGVGRDVSGKISERPDKNYATQVYADMVVGASRMEEVKLVEIICT